MRHLLGLLRWIGVSATAALFLGLTAYAQTAEEKSSAFLKIALGKEYSGSPVILKWAGPIAYSLVGSFSSPEVDFVGRHLDFLGATTGLAVGRERPVATPMNIEASADTAISPFDLSAPTPAFMVYRNLRAHDWRNILIVGNEDRLFVYRSNYFVISGSRADLTRAMGAFGMEGPIRDALSLRRALCIGYAAHEPNDARLVWAIVMIPTDLSEVERRRCFVEETTQVLGLFGDIPGSTLTLFDDRPDRGRTDLTAFDIEALKLLYSPDLKPGMKQSVIRPIVERYFKK